MGYNTPINKTGISMSETILIKRYASRRLYNTKSSEYVTLEEVAGLIRDGKEVEIRDRKSGEDLTRQFLLQIITEQQCKGESSLPINVLTGLVRSCNSSTQNMLPEFLSRSYDAFTEQQDKMVRRLSGGIPKGLTPKLGFGNPAEWQKKQAEIYGTMMQAFMPTRPISEAEPTTEPDNSSDEVSAIKEQLAELQRKLENL